MELPITHSPVEFRGGTRDGRAVTVVPPESLSRPERIRTMKRLRDRALGGAVNALRDLISERWLGEGWSLRRLHLEPDDNGRRIDVDLEGPPEIGPVSLSVYGCHVQSQEEGQTLRWSAIEVQRFGLRSEAIEAAVDGIRIGPGQARPEDGIPRALRWVLGR